MLYRALGQYACAAACRWWPKQTQVVARSTTSVITAKDTGSCTISLTSVPPKMSTSGVLEGNTCAPPGGVGVFREAVDEREAKRNYTAWGHGQSYNLKCGARLLGLAAGHAGDRQTNRHRDRQRDRQTTGTHVHEANERSNKAVVGGFALASCKQQKFSFLSQPGAFLEQLGHRTVCFSVQSSTTTPCASVCGTTLNDSGTASGRV